MSERIPPSRSYASGKRGRHKRRGSAETRCWDAEHLIPPKPEWMSAADYKRLADLRGRLPG